MLKIGVRLPSQFEDAGEYLADARALEAAGVDSLWLDEAGHEPWLVLAAIAAVTGRARLVAPVEGRRRLSAHASRRWPVSRAGGWPSPSPARWIRTASRR